MVLIIINDLLDRKLINWVLGLPKISLLYIGIVKFAYGLVIDSATVKPMILKFDEYLVRTHIDISALCLVFILLFFIYVVVTLVKK